MHSTLKIAVMCLDSVLTVQARLEQSVSSTVSSMEADGTQKDRLIDKYDA